MIDAAPAGVGTAWMMGQQRRAIDRVISHKGDVISRCRGVQFFTYSCIELLLGLQNAYYTVPYKAKPLRPAPGQARFTVDGRCMAR